MFDYRQIGYKHHWVLDFDRQCYTCLVCKSFVTTTCLISAIEEEERIHICLDRLMGDKGCREPKEEK